MSNQDQKGQKTAEKTDNDVEIQIINGEEVIVSAFQTEGKWSTFAGGNQVYHNIRERGEYEPLMTIQMLQAQNLCGPLANTEES
ncbi:MAG: hypothetical protein R3D66_04170 [Alphaproteobacteria bacterium]